MVDNQLKTEEIATTDVPRETDRSQARHRLVQEFLDQRTRDRWEANSTQWSTGDPELDIERMMNASDPYGETPESRQRHLQLRLLGRRW